MRALLKFRASDNSLKFSEHIAQKLNLPFDENEVKASAETLEHEIYHEVLVFLNKIEGAPSLKVFGFTSAQIQASLSVNGNKEIKLDRFFLFWLHSLCLLATTLAAYELDDFDNNESESEFLADTIAARQYLTIALAYKKLSQQIILIDPKIACAPIILMKLFSVYESWLKLHKYQIPNTHPLAADRKENLSNLI